MKMEQSVPKRRHIKSRRRVITQKKAYKNICISWTLRWIEATELFDKSNRSSSHTTWSLRCWRRRRRWRIICSHHHVSAPKGFLLFVGVLEPNRTREKREMRAPGRPIWTGTQKTDNTSLCVWWTKWSYSCPKSAVGSQHLELLRNKH